MMRYLLAAGCVVVYLAFCVAVGKWLKRRANERVTVVWRNPHVDIVSHSVSGTITQLDDDHILITDDNNLCVRIERRLIKDVF